MHGRSAVDPFSPGSAQVDDEFEQPRGRGCRAPPRQERAPDLRNQLARLSTKSGFYARPLSSSRRSPSGEALATQAPRASVRGGSRNGGIVRAKRSRPARKLVPAKDATALTIDHASPHHPTQRAASRVAAAGPFPAGGGGGARRLRPYRGLGPLFSRQAWGQAGRGLRRFSATLQWFDPMS